MLDGESCGADIFSALRRRISGLWSRRRTGLKTWCGEHVYREVTHAESRRARRRSTFSSGLLASVSR